MWNEGRSFFKLVFHDPILSVIRHLPEDVGRLQQIYPNKSFPRCYGLDVHVSILLLLSNNGYFMTALQKYSGCCATLQFTLDVPLRFSFENHHFETSLYHYCDSCFMTSAIVLAKWSHLVASKLVAVSQ